ncbi:MAG TPA: hypothetical protein VK612_03985, partial [Pyrinomonadaceae bacterium]|nr:hypothetical protein [Pyrinomonadaceae bacterium]
KQYVIRKGRTVSDYMRICSEIKGGHRRERCNFISKSNVRLLEFIYALCCTINICIHFAVFEHPGLGSGR